MRNAKRVDKMRLAMLGLQRNNTMLTRIKFWLRGNPRKTHAEQMRQQMEEFERYARQATEEL